MLGRRGAKLFAGLTAVITDRSFEFPTPSHAFFHWYILSERTNIPTNSSIVAWVTRMYVCSCHAVCHFMQKREHNYLGWPEKWKNKHSVQLEVSRPILLGETSEVGGNVCGAALNALLGLPAFHTNGWYDTATTSNYATSIPMRMPAVCIWGIILRYRDLCMIDIIGCGTLSSWTASLIR